MKRWILAAGSFGLAAIAVWLWLRPASKVVSLESSPTYSQPTARPLEPTASERLLEGYADPADYVAYPAEIVPLGRIGRIIEAMRQHGARDLVLAGRVTRPSLNSNPLTSSSLKNPADSVSTP